MYDPETLELKAALGALLEHMAEEGHGGLKQHTNCQPCLDANRAYRLIGVECETFDLTSVMTVMAAA